MAKKKATKKKATSNRGKPNSGMRDIGRPAPAKRAGPNKSFVDTALCNHKKIIEEEEANRLPFVPLKGGSGRKRKAIDWKQVARLCAIHATQEMIAACCGVSVSALQHECPIVNHGKSFADYIEIHRQFGCMSLLQSQFENARGGNASIQKFLGVNYLKQVERQELKVIGPVGDAVGKKVKELMKRKKK